MDHAAITPYRERLLDEVRRSLPSDDLARVEDAIAFAIEAHGEQTRISGLPYVTHPLETARKLAAMQLPRDVVVAGILHDAHEDANVPLDAIAKRCNADVAKLVAGVTKVGKIRYQGEERYVENLRKMFVAIAQDIRVMFIKFADRMHNLEDLGVVPEPKRLRIAREAMDIYAPIANRLGMGEIKGQLEDLAFPHILPEEAAWLEDLLATTQRIKRHAIGGFITAATEELDRVRIPYHSIHGRVKHRYRLYQKLLRYDRDIEKVFDLNAIRILVPTVADCYAALGILHQRWKPLKGRIKDYIANPKPNGYQSLHTTVFCEHGEIVELQIRTPEMHEDAEWGAAASWRYHERGSAKLTPRQVRWVEELVQWQRSIQDPKQFLEELKLEALRDRIFVFTPKGDVIELPEGATPVDFAYAIHTDVGNRATAARVNGDASLHPLDRPLENGDMVEIITDPKRKGPNADWLTSIRTKHARAKIRDALRGSLTHKVAGWVQAVTKKKKR